MNKLNLIEVYFANSKVGRIALLPDGVCAFEYDAEWLSTGFSISPFFLPLKSGLITAKRDPFRGNFGVFDDSLPDGWGNLLLDRFLQEQGVDPYKLNVLERLSLIGSTGRGALEYRPDQSVEDTQSYFDFNKLAQQAEELLKANEVEGSVADLYKYGGSSGGARPKIFARVDDKEYLVKFSATNDPANVGVLEYEYSLLAAECGITMAPTRLIEGKYFATERFDRTPKVKIHTVSVAGLLNADYRIPSLDYSIIMKLTMELTKDMTQVAEMFRRMVFNVLISNMDDHAKNFSYQRIDGDWKLSPAYDILPSSGFNGYHTTTINNTGAPKLADVLAVGTEVGLTEQNMKLIIEELTEVCLDKKMLKFRLK